MRQKLWKSIVLSTENARQWFVGYFDTKLQLCQIGKKIAIGFSAIVLTIILVMLVKDFHEMDLDRIARLIKGFFYMIALPVAIFFAARWQEKNIRVSKENYLQQFQLEES